MTALEARKKTDALIDILSKADESVKEVYEKAGRKAAPLLEELRKGRAWVAMGLPDWKTYVETCLGMSIRRSQQLRKAYDIEQQLLTFQPSPEANPVRIGDISERVCRELGRVADVAARTQIWDQCNANGKTTAPEVAKAVKEYHSSRNPQTAKDKIAELNATKQKLREEVEKSDRNDQLAHEDTCEALLRRCLKRYEQIEDDAIRARRHHGIACGNLKDAIMERHINSAVARAQAKQESLKKEIAAMEK